MAKEVEVRLRLEALDRTGRALKSLRGNLDDVHRKVRQINQADAALGRVRSRVGAVDAALMGAARYIAPVAAITAATKALNAYAEVQDRLDRMGIAGNATEEAMDGVGVKIREIAQEVGLSIDEVTSGVETMIAAGLSAEQAMGLLPSAARAAQASDAAMTDIAASAVAVGDAFEIAAGQMEHAFDIMVASGNLGKFELKDMAQYLPSLAPLAATRGYTGTEGLKRITAMLQVIRGQTGNAEQAANGMRDLLSKMETNESANRFEEFGIDIRKWMEDARAKGQDEVEAFLAAVTQAIGTDYAKLPQLIGEQDSKNAVLALLRGQEELQGFITQLGSVDGTVGEALLRLTDNLEQGFQRVNNAVLMVGESAGKMIESFGLPEGLRMTVEMLDRVSDQIDELTARRGGFFSDQGPFRDGGPLGKGSAFNQVVGTESFGYAGIAGAYTDLISGASGEPGDFYNSVMSEWMAAAWEATKDFLAGELPVPLPTPAPGRPPAAVPFAMQPDDRQAPAAAGGTAPPLPSNKPARGAAAPAIPWDAYPVPHGRPGPDAAPSGPPGAPFQMRTDDVAAPIVAAAATVSPAVETFVAGMADAGEAAARFRTLLDGVDWPSRHASEMTDDELLAALRGELPDDGPPPFQMRPGDATLGGGGGFRTEAEIDGIGDAADAAAEKLSRLPSAIRPDELAAAGRQGGQSFGSAFIGELRASLTEAEALVRASAARMSAAGSFTGRPVISPRIVAQHEPKPVRADRGHSMADISERT